jgi:hypothetical protein
MAATDEDSLDLTESDLAVAPYDEAADRRGETFEQIVTRILWATSNLRVAAAMTFSDSAGTTALSRSTISATRASSSAAPAAAP